MILILNFSLSKCFLTNFIWRLLTLQARDSDDEDELKYADDVDMPGQKFETKQRITVRNLRIREDRAKV